MNYFAILSLLFLASSCSETSERVKDLRSGEPIIQEDNKVYIEDESSETLGKSLPEFPKGEPSSSKWSYKVTKLSEGNYGYQLFDGETMVINQTSIPSVQGINGFQSSAKAEKTAAFIVRKLEKGIFPPTVNKQELDSLGVLRN